MILIILTRPVFSRLFLGQKKGKNSDLSVFLCASHKDFFSFFRNREKTPFQTQTKTCQTEKGARLGRLSLKFEKYFFLYFSDLRKVDPTPKLGYKNERVSVSWATGEFFFCRSWNSRVLIGLGATVSHRLERIFYLWEKKKMSETLRRIRHQSLSEGKVRFKNKIIKNY